MRDEHATTHVYRAIRECYVDSHPGSANGIHASMGPRFAYLEDRSALGQLLRFTLAPTDTRELGDIARASVEAVRDGSVAVHGGREPRYMGLHLVRTKYGSWAHQEGTWAKAYERL